MPDIMPEIWSRRVATARALIALCLLGPLLPGLALAGRLVGDTLTGSAVLDARWGLLALLGPAIPVYLIVLPLLPFGLRGLRRGWTPRVGPSLLALVVLSALCDLVFYLARD